jgi:hypothetical protein
LQQTVAFKNKTYAERWGNTKDAPSISASGDEELPSNRMGKSDGNSSNKVRRTALSCSCACNIKFVKLRKRMMQ